MSLQVEDVLALWREAERLLEALPEQAEEHDLVRDEVGRLRALYRAMTERATEPTSVASASAIEHSRRVIERAQERIARSSES